MAAQQQNITIAAPGFGGINTEISPTQQGESFASIADNCIIDRYGRIGARKGFDVTTSDGSAYGGLLVQKVFEHLAEDGTTVVFSAAGNAIYQGEDVPVDVTPGGATITGDDWQIVTFNDDAYFFQRGHTAMRYDYSTNTLALGTGVLPRGNCAVAAYGRLWVADIDGDQSTIYWSDLLIGTDFAGGSSGSINIAEYWPRGHDTITAIAAHNGFLIVFGKESILVYSGAEGDPATTLTLQDTVNGIGCLARDTIASIGTDIYFLDESGVRSFARTIQEKSLPIGEISKNVRTLCLDYIRNESVAGTDHRIAAVFSPEESLYIVLFPTNGVSLVFSTKNLFQDGAARATQWTGLPIVTATNTPSGRLLIGGLARLGIYNGYLDGGASYNFRYYSNPFAFGSPVALKFPKQVDFTLIAAGGGDIQVLWSFDYSTNYRSKTLTLMGTGAPAYYGVDEYNEAVYTGGVILDRIKANTGGSGVVVTIGLETEIAESEFSIQEMNVQALLGRIV